MGLGDVRRCIYCASTEEVQRYSAVCADRVPPLEADAAEASKPKVEPPPAAASAPAPGAGADPADEADEADEAPAYITRVVSADICDECFSLQDTASQSTAESLWLLLHWLLSGPKGNRRAAIGLVVLLALTFRCLASPFFQSDPAVSLGVIALITGLVSPVVLWIVAGGRRDRFRRRRGILRLIEDSPNARYPILAPLRDSPEFRVLLRLRRGETDLWSHPVAPPGDIGGQSPGTAAKDTSTR